MKFNILFILLIFSKTLSQSKSEIQQAKNYIESQGLSESQARKLAKDQGFSENQINKVIENELNKTQSEQVLDELKTDNIEFENFDKSNNQLPNQTLNNNVNPIDYTQELLPIIDENEDSEVSVESINNSQDGIITHFGYDIFQRDPALFQASSSGAVDPDYIIGPGDEIIFMMWGETQFRQVLIVDREGFIFVPEIGQVFVNGLNLNLLESKLFRVLSQSYSSLKPQGGKATTFLDISLGNLRPLRIQVVGEVAQPGAYTISPSATLFSSLYYFNGPTVRGSLRDIKLIRNGKTITSIDFYDYLLTGKKKEDRKLQLDDVIFIPNRLKTVSIKGEINRPGIYELKEEETFKDILKMAGGLSITAYLERAQIDRIVPFEDRIETGMDRLFNDIKLGEVLSSEQIFKLYDGDVIEIFSVQSLRQNIAEIEGSISRPGSYDLGDSLRLGELIKKADGLQGDAYLDRVDVVRLKSDFTEKLIKLDLDKALNGDKEHNILLKNQDRIRIYGMTEMIPRTYVSIQGQVKRPGRYLLQENMNLYDLIFKAGGFIDEQFKSNTYLERAELVRVNKKSGKKFLINFHLGEVLLKKNIANELLEPNDAIRVYSLSEIEGETKFVSIGGNVKYPGRYELFQENMKLYDLLFKSGGFNDEQFKASTYLERADLFRYDENGINRIIYSFDLGKLIKNKNSLQNYELMPGDEILVYSKSVLNTQRFIKIDGAVLNPDEYELKENMTLKDLILEAGGVTKDVFRYKIEIARINIDSMYKDSLAEIINLEMLNDYSISKVLESDKLERPQNNQFFLRPYDNIFIREDPYYNLQKRVTVLGSVYYPGEYIITRNDQTITEVVERAGGLTFDAFPYGSIFERNGKVIKIDLEKVLKKGGSKKDMIVQNGDIIRIVSKPKIIEVQGEVNTPGFYKYVEKQRVKDLIKNSGGLTVNADKSSIFIQYPSGKSKRYRGILSNPKVKDGSRVYVNAKNQEEPLDKTELAKTITTVFANIAQALSLLLVAKS